MGDQPGIRQHRQQHQDQEADVVPYPGFVERSARLCGRHKPPPARMVDRSGELDNLTSAAGPKGSGAWPNVTIRDAQSGTKKRNDMSRSYHHGLPPVRTASPPSRGTDRRPVQLGPGSTPAPKDTGGRRFGDSTRECDVVYRVPGACAFLLSLTRILAHPQNCANYGGNRAG